MTHAIVPITRIGGSSSFTYWSLSDGGGPLQLDTFVGDEGGASWIITAVPNSLFWVRPVFFMHCDSRESSGGGVAPAARKHRQGERGAHLRREGKYMYLYDTPTCVFI